MINKNKCPFEWKFNSFDLLYDLAVKKHIMIQRWCRITLLINHFLGAWYHYTNIIRTDKMGVLFLHMHQFLITQWCIWFQFCIKAIFLFWFNKIFWHQWLHSLTDQILFYGRNIEFIIRVSLTHSIKAINTYSFSLLATSVLYQ